MPDSTTGPTAYAWRLDDAGAVMPDVSDIRRYDYAGELLNPHRRESDGALLCEGLSVREGVLEYRRADGSIRRELVTRQALIDTAKSGARAPMTLDHPADGFVSPDTAQRLCTGDVDGAPAVEEDAQGGFVRVKVALRTRDAIDAFDRGEARQLSWGYAAVLDETPGEHPVFGRYDARQIGRVINHLAQVPRGRSAGAELRKDSADAYAIGPHRTDHREGHMKPGLVAMLTMLGVSRFDNEDAAIADGTAILRKRKDAEEAAAAEAEKEPDPEAPEMVAKAELDKAKADLAAMTGERNALKAEKDKAEADAATKRDAAELAELKGIAAKLGIKADALDLPGLRLALAKTKLDSLDATTDAGVIDGVLRVVRADAAKGAARDTRYTTDSAERTDAAADAVAKRFANPTLDAIDDARRVASGGAQ